MKEQFAFMFGNDYIQVSSLAESSKELEELRGAFSRALDYMKQDVEESKWT